MPRALSNQPAHAVPTPIAKRASGLLGRGLLVCCTLWATLPAAALQLVGDRFVTPAGQPVAARWACGLTTPADLSAYRAAGFNVVYVDLPGRDAAANEAARRLAAAAGEQGFDVILALNPIDAIGEPRLDVSDPAAVRRTLAWLATAATQWQDQPGLLAYALQEDLEERLDWPVRGFQQFLAADYDQDPLRLSRHWGGRFERFTDLSPEVAQVVDSARPGGVGRASMDLARWRREGIETLLRRWVTGLQAVDPAHPVIGGRMDRFRTLLAAPGELSGLQPAMLARTGWRDQVLHEAGAVQVASQAGRYAAIPTLESAGSPADLRRWTRVMFGRGAAGVAYASWPELRDNAARAAAVHAALAEADELRLAEFRPQCVGAVVLDPLCRGALLDGRQVYGFGSFGGDEPAGLYELLRRSTRRGPLAVLRPRDLTRVRLSQYGCLFLPACFDLSPLAIEALASYVAGGGALLADLGLGCYEPSGDLSYLPPPLDEVLGVRALAVQTVGDVALTGRQQLHLRSLPAGEVPFPEFVGDLAQPGSLLVRYTHTLFPDLEPAMHTPASMALTLLRTPAAFVLPGPRNAHLLGWQAELGGPRPAARPAVAGLSVNQYQRGAAAFCSTWIWQEWQPDHPFFDAIHDGLLGQRPQLTRVDTRQLCDDLTAVARADHRLWLHRLLDAPLTTMVDVPSLDGQIWVDGLNVVRRAPPPDEASPVRGGVAPLIIRRLIRLDGAEVRCEEAAPVAVWPAREPAAVALVAYGADRIVLRAEGSGEQAEMDRLGQWRLTDARPCTMTIVITDGRYPVAPGSLHRMRWVTWFGKAIPTQPAEVGVGRGDDTITAGPDGRLVLHPTEPGQLITLTPVSPPPPAPAAATE